MRFGLTPFETRTLDAFEDFFTNQRSRMVDQTLVKLKVDLEDRGEDFLLTADLPGFSKDEIHVEVDEDILTIEAERKEESQKEDKNYICKERRSHSFVRKFDVSGVKVSDISGKFENGVLELELPKKDEHIKTSKKIELQGGNE